MNRENILAAIAIMRRAKNVDMQFFQTSVPPRHIASLAENEQELHACGNFACFAGHVAVSHEWKAVGGVIACDGSPSIRVDGKWWYEKAHAIAYWLEIEFEAASNLVYGDTVEPYWYNNGIFSRYYDKNWEQVRAPDVIAKLEELLAGAKE